MVAKAIKKHRVIILLLSISILMITSVLLASFSVGFGAWTTNDDLKSMSRLVFGVIGLQLLLMSVLVLMRVRLKRNSKVNVFTTLLFVLGVFNIYGLIRVFVNFELGKYIM